METALQYVPEKANILDIGDRVKMLRLLQKRTLQEVADSCGLSKSMISKIENNHTVPSVATLVKLAACLGTNVSNLLEKDGWKKVIVTTRGEAEEKLVATEKGYEIFPYASAFHEKKMQPFLFVARKGRVKHHELVHEGEEFIFVVDGEMRMQIGDVEYRLGKGDSIYFNSMQRHGITPISNEVVYLDIFV